MDQLSGERIRQPKTLQKIAYDKIKYLLTSGKMQNDEVYSANKLAQTLGVSRTPIREALLQLTGEGLLRSLGRRGFQVNKFTKKQIRDLFEVRRLIEPFVIEQMCGILNDDDIAPLIAAMDAACKGKKKDFDKFIEADKQFHMMLIDRHGNEIFMNVMENIRDLISVLGLQAISKPGRVKEVIAEHNKIVEGLLKNEPEMAVKGMLDHLHSTEETLIGIMDKN
ncbi:MAG: GntR family transcriptional regulator [Proteobacteria bacterium]|nr:GntR family transcriptional regulator [Pseudomonadota bacterium]MBU1452693.1 GntR family transcriptional regulator [Pseudomonadota bacterium]MBU2467216.1 GntR family transcriptional regulator [Pseudomonadota bacterium]MBU2518980.1 GntR family transcriptional regulator [Pseudomonadota bacterium]